MNTCQRIAWLTAAAGMTTAASADVIITEVFYNPAGAEAETEWVELYNNGTEPVDISGYRLGDEDNNSPSDSLGAGALLNLDGTISPESETDEIVNSVIIQPGEAIVVGAFWDARTENPDANDNTMEAFVQSWGMDTDDDGLGDTTDFRVILLVNTVTIANTASLTNEVLRLDDENGNIVDFQNYEVGRSDNTWPFSSNGRSIYLQPNFLNNADNENGLAWAIATEGIDGGYAGREVLNDADMDGELTVLYADGDIASPGFVESSLGASFTDANGNGRDDAVDIFLGVSDDCDRNRVPDEAQPDCDGNGTPDVCDGFLTESDCDRDGQPDSCQIDNDASLDLNGNGILDTCEGISGNLVITEIMFNPSGSESEYIEFFNDSDTAIDIAGYYFQDFDAPIADGPEGFFPAVDDTDMDGTPDAFLVEPGGIVVIGDETTENWEAGWGPISGYRYAQVSISLANNSDLVNENRTLLRGLFDDMGNQIGAVVVDNANYSGTTSNGVAQNGWPGDDGRGSFHLTSFDGSDIFNTVDNNDGANWALSIEGLNGARSPMVSSRFDGRDVGSPGFINFGAAERPAGDVLISEIMFATNSDFPGQPGFDAPPGLDEWVEIHNTTASAIDISGWQIADEDGETQPFPAGTTLAAGETAVIYGFDFDNNATPVTEFYNAWEGGYQVIAVQGWYNAFEGNPGINRLGDTGEAGTASNPSAGREILRLITDAGVVQDIVNYDDDGFVWPLVANGLIQNEAWSIYIFNNNDLNELDNDSGLNWAPSFEGFNGGRTNATTTIFNGDMDGSPGFIDDINAPLDTDFFPSVDPVAPVCLADFNGDDSINILDVVDFINNWNAQGEGSDFNGDMMINILDVVDFIAEWNAGCP